MEARRSYVSYRDFAAAYSEPHLEFGVEAGIAPPTGPMTDVHNVGRSFGAGLSYLIDDQLALDVVSIGLDQSITSRSTRRRWRAGPCRAGA